MSSRNLILLQKQYFKGEQQHIFNFLVATEYKVRFRSLAHLVV